MVTAASSGYRIKLNLTNNYVFPPALITTNIITILACDDYSEIITSNNQKHIFG